MRIALLAIVVVGCDAPTIAVASDDTSTDAAETAVDARPACPNVRFDGGVCTGHDEDDDCTPDVCDDCPNVPQDPIVASSGSARAGPSCTHLPPFDKISTRLFFADFKGTRGTWSDPAGAFGDERFRVHDDYARIGIAGGVERLAHTDIGAANRDVVVTAVMRMPEGVGFAGLALRVNPTPTIPGRSAYLCVIRAMTFALHAILCDSSNKCSQSPVLDEKGAAVQKPLPLDIAFEESFLMRAAARTVGSSVELGCQIFPTPRTPTEVAGTLGTTLNTKNTLLVTTSTVIPSGEPGVYAFGAPLEILSFDVLVAP